MTIHGPIKSMKKKVIWSARTRMFLHCWRGSNPNLFTNLRKKILLIVLTSEATIRNFLKTRINLVTFWLCHMCICAYSNDLDSFCAYDCSCHWLGPSPPSWTKQPGERAVAMLSLHHRRKRKELLGYNATALVAKKKARPPPLPKVRVRSVDVIVMGIMVPWKSETESNRKMGRQTQLLQRLPTRLM